MGWLVNTAILSRPLNWLTIGAMLLLVAFGAIAIYSRAKSTSTGGGSDAPAVSLAKEV